MEITKGLALNDIAEDEDFIEMELISSPQSKEFEFQKMSLSSTDKQPTTSSADELFFNGKLLPLHLPPRQTLLHPTAATFFTCSASAPCTTTTTALNTPLDSCNISPSESCRVSCELKPDDDFFFQWSSTEITSFINPATKKPWLKKLKLINIKHSTILGQKLKASRAYLRSIFSKPEEKGSSSKSEKKLISRLVFYPRMKNIETEDSVNKVQRRSFSGAMKRHYYPSSSSSSSASSSFNSSGLNESEFLRRSSSATEIEVSVDAAIAHCKNSQQIRLG